MSAASMRSAPMLEPGPMRWLPLPLIAALGLATLLLTGCPDGDIRRGCENWCKCHKGDQSASACYDACSDTLKKLKKRDRPKMRQTAECLAGKGMRHCKEITLCGQGVLKPAKSKGKPKK